MAEIRILWDLPRFVRDWPEVGGTCEVSDEEAENMVYHGWAEYVEAPEDDDPDETLDYEPVYSDPDSDEDDDFGYGVGSSDGDNEVEEEHRRPPRALVVKKPRSVDPKSKWLEYARAQGYSGDDTITKNQLIAKYSD